MQPEGSSVSVAKRAINRQATSRPYLWSFFGRVHNDRKTLMHLLEPWEPHYRGYGASPQKMLEYYMQSQFVPNGKGNVHFDCFRLYEATIAGAVPVYPIKATHFFLGI